jgi:DNA-directed RNA polymerase specialized sigma54-like protein
MKYSKFEIGNELKTELNKGYDIERISNWASDTIFDSRHESSKDIKDILDHISIMDAGPEFEYSEQELRMLVDLLISDEQDPIKVINNLKSRESN